MEKLKRALVVYLKDQNKGESDCNLNIKSTDEEFVEEIVSQLSEGDVCPFKNYMCTDICNGECGEDRFDIDCGKENEDVWRDFISKNEPH